MNKGNADYRRFYCAVEPVARTAARLVEWDERAEFMERWGLLPPEVLRWAADVLFPWMLDFHKADLFATPEETIAAQPYEFLHAWDKWRELYPAEMSKFKDALRAR